MLIIGFLSKLLTRKPLLIEVDDELFFTKKVIIIVKVSTISIRKELRDVSYSQTANETP